MGPDKNDCAWALTPAEIGGRETIAGQPRLIGASGQEPISGEEKSSPDHPVRTADERVDWCSGLTASGLLVLALAGEGEFHWSRATTSSGTCPPTREAVSGRWDTLSASVSSCRWAATSLADAVSAGSRWSACGRTAPSGRTKEKSSLRDR